MPGSECGCLLNAYSRAILNQYGAVQVATSIIDNPQRMRDTVSEEAEAGLTDRVAMRLELPSAVKSA